MIALIYLCHVLAVAAFIAAAALDHVEHKHAEQNRTKPKQAIKKQGKSKGKSKMKENYDPNNGETIEGKSIHNVVAAARVRFGGNYLVMNTQTYNDPHWKAIYNTAKGDAGMSSHERRKQAPQSLSEGGKNLM
ncbi:hypothetical protein [Bacillus mycoides]|uniref:hypothetical protein n=1 Tax=Bacillus mycoides TaxID=1405 RepID=UPI0002799B3F|nr:hypothetical protein [Bacillus mycoides]EJS03424.1 hypothetical protein IKM_02597 [Bacillus mycoides]